MKFNSQLEADVAEWLITHKDGLQSLVSSRHLGHYDLFPDSYFYVYVDTYADNVRDIIKSEVMSHLNINPESLLFLDKKFVIMVGCGTLLKIPN